MKAARTLLVLAYLPLWVGCGRGLSDERAVELVRLYNDRVAEAYRTGDFRLAERVAGPREQTKLLGLIGSKSDMGITLDAEMTEFKVLKVESSTKGVEVHTEERWHYRDRRIGTGEQVGEESTDHYFMTYRLGRPEGRWVVEEIRFAREPEVGRTEVHTRAPAAVFHGERMPDPGAGPPPHASGGATR